MGDNQEFELEIRCLGPGELRISYVTDEPQVQVVECREGWNTTTLRFRRNRAGGQGRVTVTALDGPVGLEWLEIRPLVSIRV
jgi:hypothetical protein